MNSSILTKSSLSEEADVDRSIVKIYSLAALGIISFLFSGYFFKLFLKGDDLNDFLISAIAAAISLIIVLFQILFIKDIWRINLICLAEVLGLFAIFYDKLAGVIMLPLGALLFLLFLLSANYVGVKELRNMLKINFWRVSRIVLPKAIAGSLIFFCFAFVGLNVSENKFFISRNNFEKILASTSGIIQKFFPVFDQSLNIHEMALNMANERVNETPQFQNLPKIVKNQVIDQAVSDFENNISKIAGSHINPQLKIGEAIYEIIKMKFDEASSKNQIYVLAGISLALFFIAESLAMPIRLVISFFAYLIYEISFALGFVFISLENRSREIIVLK